MKRLTAVLSLAVVLLALLACSSPAPRSTEAGRAQSPPAATAAPAPVPVAPVITAPPPSPQYTPSTTDRMVVRNGSLNMMVENVSATIDKINGLAGAYGGYTVSSNIGKQGDRLVGTISVRMPAERFADAMNSFRELALEVTSETSSSQDVTQEYVDLQAKLRSLQATADQLYKVMDKATRVEDILAIQREITNVQTQIEQTKGRIQYLERTSATSLINVRLEQGVLIINFTADQALASTGDAVRFTSQVSGGYPPYSYEWDFGDGQISNAVHPGHSYQSGGIYSVTLKVTDDKRNAESKTRERYLSITSKWSPGNVASTAWSALKIFGEVVVNIIIWLGIFSPVWIIALVIMYLVRRRAKRNAV